MNGVGPLNYLLPWHSPVGAGWRLTRLGVGFVTAFIRAIPGVDAIRRARRHLDANARYA